MNGPVMQELAKSSCPAGGTAEAAVAWLDAKLGESQTRLAELIKSDAAKTNIIADAHCVLDHHKVPAEGSLSDRIRILIDKTQADKAHYERRLSYKDAHIKTLENRLDQAERALAGLSDSFSNWSDIHGDTGLSEARCKEIFSLCRAAVEKQGAKPW